MKQYQKLKPYKSYYEQVQNDIDERAFEKEKEAKLVQKLIKQMKTNTSTNKEARAEFAKNIFQLALSSDPLARLLIKKIILFISFFGEDFYISEDEWRKLNNTDKLDGE